MSNRVDFGNEGTVLHAVFIHFKVELPWTSLAWFVNLFYFLYKSDKTESQSLNIKLSFMFGSIKSPVQHSISSSQSFNIYCTPSVLSRADALDCSAKTQILVSIYKHQLCYACHCQHWCQII